MVGARLTASSLVVVFLSCSLAQALRAAEPDASSAQSPVKEALEKSAEEMVTDAAKPHWSDIFKDRPIGCWRLDVGGTLFRISSPYHAEASIREDFDFKASRPAVSRSRSPYSSATTGWLPDRIQLPHKT